MPGSDQNLLRGTIRGFEAIAAQNRKKVTLPHVVNARLPLSRRHASFTTSQIEPVIELRGSVQVFQEPAKYGIRAPFYVHDTFGPTAFVLCEVLLHFFAQERFRSSRTVGTPRNRTIQNRLKRFQNLGGEPHSRISVSLLVRKGRTTPSGGDITDSILIKGALTATSTN